MTSSATTLILIIADRAETIGSLSTRLAQEEAFLVQTASDMETGLAKAQMRGPSLIIVDLEERAEVVYLCGVLKSDQETRSIPIVILNENNDAEDRIAGLELGADDSIGQPCNPREIVLRVKAVLRRARHSASKGQFVRGPIQVDSARCHVAVNDRRIHLTAIEFKLLRALVEQPGQVLNRERLFSEARANGDPLESRTVDTHIRRLRRKLGKAAKWVETVRGSGYRLRNI